ncbi:MAG TPA: hypothetical protein VIY73_22995 [Polyangiaceae bacterium]
MSARFPWQPRLVAASALVLALVPACGSGSHGGSSAPDASTDGSFSTDATGGHEGSSGDGSTGVDAALDAAGADANGTGDAPSDAALDGLDASLDGGAGGHAIGPGFFGMHTNTYGNGFVFGAERLWDSGTGWSQLQTAATTYDFTPLQSRVADATKGGFDLLFTWGRTPPSFAAKSSVTCDYGNDGQCDPPDDVATDGTGTDAHAKAFWTQLMTTMCTGTAPDKTCGPLKYFEMWNEPNADQFWSGTYAQLARMGSDAAAIIKGQCKSCVVLTPGVACGGDGYHANGDSGQCQLWAAAYLQAWKTLSPNLLPDAGAWHPYPAHTNVIPSPFPETNVSTWDTCAQDAGDAPSCTCKAAFVPNPECRYSVVDQIQVLRGVFDQNGLAGKPMIATEGSWNEVKNLPDPDLQAAFLARWYLVQAGAGVEAAYWYAEDATVSNGGWGRLLTSPEAGAPVPNPAGTAYEQLHEWLVGGSIAPCTPAGTVWSCAVVDPSGKPGTILWDTAESCATGTCTTHPQAVAASYQSVTDLAGQTQAIQGHEVAIGAKPVLAR